MDSTEETQAHPALLSATDGLLYSGWFAAVHSSYADKLSSGPPGSPVTLQTLPDVPQECLARVIKSLYTSYLDVDSLTVQTLLDIADYLQASS